MTTDERIDWLLQELGNEAGEFDTSYKEPLREIVKQFMQDMGENIVRSQAVDEFANYVVDNQENSWWIHGMKEEFKQEKGYI